MFVLFGFVVVVIVGLFWLLCEIVFMFGIINGVYVVVVIGLMMVLVGVGGEKCEGVWMGFWGVV